MDRTSSSKFVVKAGMYLYFIREAMQETLPR
jgi:hypothetical protein